MADITARIKGDTSQYLQAIRQAEAASRRLSDSTSAVGTRLVDIGRKGNANLRLLRRDIKGLRGDMKGLAGSTKSFGREATTASNKGIRGFLRLKGGLGSVSAAISGLGGQLAAFAGIGLGAQLLGDVAKLTLDLERAQAEVATIVDTSTVNLPEITERVREIAAAAGFDAVNSVKALYQAISAGQEPAQAVKLIETSAKLAKAGLTDLAGSTDVLTTVLNAYNLSADKASLVSDALFKTVEKGKTTLPELTSNLGNVIPIAAQAGVGITDLGGALAALTAGGLRTDIAVTSLRALLAKLIKPTKDAQAVAAELGIEFNTAAVRAQGFVPFITNLRQKLKEFEAAGGDSERALATLAGRVQGVTAAAALTGNQFDKFVESANDVNKGLGATEKAANKIDKTFGQRLKVASETIKKGFADVGLEATELGVALLDLGKAGDKTATSLLDVLGSELKNTAITTLNALKAGVQLLNEDFTGFADSLETIKSSIADLVLTVAKSPLARSFAEAFGIDTSFADEIKQFEKFGGDAKALLEKGIGEKLGLDDLIDGAKTIDEARKLGDEIGKTLKDQAGLKEFSEDFIKSVADARAALADAGIGDAAIANLRISDIPSEIRDLFSGDVLKATIEGIRTDTIENAFRTATRDGIDEGAKKAAQTIKEGLKAGTEEAARGGGVAVPDLFSQVQSAFSDLENDAADLARALEATAAINPDPRAVKQAEEEIRKLQARISIFGAETADAGRLTDEGLRKLLSQFANFREKVLGKIDPAELAFGIGRFMRKAVSDAKRPVEETGKLFGEATRRAKRPTDAVSRLFSDAAKFSRLTIDSPELLGLDPAKVAAELGGFGLETQIIINDNLRLVRRATTKGFRVLFEETNESVLRRFNELRASRQQQDMELAQTFESGASSVRSSGGNFVSALRDLSGAIVSSVSGVVQSTRISTENLTQSQRRIVNQFLRQQQFLSNLALQRSPGFSGLISTGPGLGAAGGLGNLSSPFFGFQRGGVVRGAGRGDRVPAALEPGEFVVPRDATARFGPLLEAIRQLGNQSSAGAGAPIARPVNVENVVIEVNGGDASADELADAVLARVLRLGELGQLESLQR